MLSGREIAKMNFTSLKLRNAAGIALIVLGIIAVPLPIIPGTPLIAAGVALLGPQHPLILSSQAWLRRLGILREQKEGNRKKQGLGL